MSPPGSESQHLQVNRKYARTHHQRPRAVFGTSAFEGRRRVYAGACAAGGSRMRHSARRAVCGLPLRVRGPGFIVASVVPEH